MKILCPHCWAENEDIWEFCQKCGDRLSKKPQKEKWLPPDKAKLSPDFIGDDYQRPPTAQERIPGSLEKLHEIQKQRKASQMLVKIIFALIFIPPLIILSIYFYLTGWKPITTLTEHDGEVHALCFSPLPGINQKGEMCWNTMASGSLDGTIKIWDTQSWQCTKTISAHKDGVYALIFSPDGRLLVSGGDNGMIKVWEMTTKGEEPEKELFTLEGHKKRIKGFAFSNRGTLLASCSSDNTCIIWDLDSKQTVRTMDLRSTSTSAGFLRDNQWVALGTGSFPMIWDIGDGKPFKTLKNQYENQDYNFVSVSPGGDLLATLNTSDGLVRIWNTNSWESIQSMGWDKIATNFDVSWSGKWVAVGYNSGMVKIYDMKSGGEKASFKQHDSEVHCLRFSPDGKFLISGGKDRIMQVWQYKRLEDYY